MNALTLLKQDHGNVEGLFHHYENLPREDVTERRRVVDRIIEQLAVHAAIEEQLFYPTIRATAPEAEDDTLEGLEEHHIVKWTLSELDGMSPTEERFHAKVTVLIESVRHHVEEEENELFPLVRDAMTVQQLDELGTAMEEAKAAAPTRPHPRQPDTPPLNIITGVPAAVIDRVQKLGKETVERILNR